DAPAFDAGNPACVVERVFGALGVPVKDDEEAGQRAIGRVLDEDPAVDGYFRMDRPHACGLEPNIQPEHKLTRGHAVILRVTQLALGHGIAPVPEIAAVEAQLDLVHPVTDA